MPIKLNSSQHIVPDNAVGQPQTATAGAALGANIAVYIKVADGKLYPFDGTELDGAAIVGITDAAYAMGAVATYYPPGTTLTTTVTLTIGEVFAKDDGTLVPASGLTTGGIKFSECVGQASSANKLLVSFKGQLFLVS